MKCPNCNINLLMADKQGVEIDYCPECRGIWLDRGELEKIIDKSAQVNSESNRTPSYNNAQHNNEYDSHNRSGHNNQSGNYGQKKHKKENFLLDLFDFGG